MVGSIERTSTSSESEAALLEEARQRFNEAEQVERYHHRGEAVETVERNITAVNPAATRAT